MAIGGGFWTGGLHNAGMNNDMFDVLYFPTWKVRAADQAPRTYTVGAGDDVSDILMLAASPYNVGLHGLDRFYRAVRGSSAADGTTSR